jgi:hypothetical protein
MIAVLVTHRGVLYHRCPLGIGGKLVTEMISKFGQTLGAGQHLYDKLHTFLQCSHFVNC